MDVVKEAHESHDMMARRSVTMQWQGGSRCDAEECQNAEEGSQEMSMSKETVVLVQLH